MTRRVEDELLPFCEKNQITLQTYSPIEHGLLTGKIKSDYVAKPGEVRENSKWWLPANRKLVIDMMAQWKDLTEKYNCTLGNLVIQWTMSQSDHINVLIGARKPEHVAENMKAADIILEQIDIQRMTQDASNIIAKSK